MNYIKKRLLRSSGTLSTVLTMLIVLIGLPILPSHLNSHADSVTYTSFEAIGLDGQVHLIWETATEQNNSGFYVNRSTSLTGTKDRIVVYIPGVDPPLPLVPSMSDGLTNTIYDAYDRNVENGTTYYYWIESLSYDGPPTWSNPQLATPQVGITETATPRLTPTGSLTPNLTPSATRTITPGGQTLTSTPSRTPTFSASATTLYLSTTSTPLPPLPGAADTIVPTGTLLITGTATLAPLPSIELLFPLVTDTGTPTPTSLAEPALAGIQSSGASGNSGMSPDIILLIVVIVIIWMLLGAFLFFYIRRIGST